ncbi:MAG: sigma-70 family RNA polymerase sigma factor [Solirubrobacteraceae bacterium]|jgi:DNA-directed RNA polymerase specialized sigma24 family protein|nr:sigma-70 family RNA polymerase sigma factor [Solirubrobacteraceae bacterium]
MTPATDARSSADRVLEREYEELRRPTINALRARLASRRIRFDDADLDAFYNQAWHGLHEQLVQGEDIENRGGFLVQAAYRRSIDELRRLHPDQRADGVDTDALATEPDLAAAMDDRRRLRELVLGMREGLDERERQAAALCYLHGFSRPEAAQAMGVSPRRMEKLMDGVSRKLGAITDDIDAGTWCESHQSLMKAYAYGVLDPDGERHAIAEAHLRECSGCRRYVRGLRGMGAVLPPVALPLAALGLLGAGAAAGAGAAGAGGGSGAGGSAGAGAGASGAAGAGGGLGGFAVAGIAAAAVAAAGAGAFAVVSSSGGGDEDRAAPPAARTAAPKPAPAPKAKAPAAPRPAAAPQPAPKPVAASAAAADPASTPAASPAPEPAPVPVAAPEPAPASEPEPPAVEPTVDGEQEFGFER